MLKVARILVFLIGCCASLGAQSAQKSPNILLIAVDDLRPELGCYGARHAPSPHIDRLAQEGVLFTRHFVQVPTCGASRYALLTGRRPARSGVRAGNEGLYRGKSALLAAEQEGAQSLPELFRRSGYKTVCLGKISHTPDGRVFQYNGQGDGRPELPHAWDLLPTPFGPWQRGWGAFFAYADGKHREDGGGHRALMEFTAASDDDLPDGLIAAAAVRQIEALAAQEEPFFLGVGFYKPHLPFVAPRADWEAVQALDLPPPAAAQRPASAYWHKSGEFYKYDAPFEKTHPLAAADAQRARRAYLACVRYVDRQIGRVLAALERTGAAQDTIVVLWSDHGWFLGETAMWGKHSPHERALWSPLIVRAPGLLPAGETCAAVVETVDLFPTLIELAQPAFTHTHFPLDGQSLASARSRTPGQAVAVSHWGRATSVRSAGHRLIFEGSPEAPRKIELYALLAGRDPVRDLASERPGIVRHLLRAARGGLADF